MFCFIFSFVSLFLILSRVIYQLLVLNIHPLRPLWFPGERARVRGAGATAGASEGDPERGVQLMLGRRPACPSGGGARPVPGASLPRRAKREARAGISGKLYLPRVEGAGIANAKVLPRISLADFTERRRDPGDARSVPFGPLPLTFFLREQRRPEERRRR